MQRTTGNHLMVFFSTECLSEVDFYSRTSYPWLKMTNQDDRITWPPALFANQLQQASENVAEQQLDMWEQMVSGNAGAKDDELSKIKSLGSETAIFKTRVQSGGRISIPDAEREALDIAEGDIVQTIVIPIKNQSEETHE
jgi:hypothetical protein